MDHYEAYIKDLLKMKDMGFDKLYLVHTTSLDPAHVVVDANHKIGAYLKYREDRVAKIYDFVKQRRKVGKFELFQYMYAHEDMHDNTKLWLVITSFNAQVRFLCDSGRLKQIKGDIVVC